MFSILPSTVYYHINYFIQVFTQPLDSHIKNMKPSNDYGVHAQGQDKRLYRVFLHITLSKTVSLSKKLSRSNLNVLDYLLPEV